MQVNTLTTKASLICTAARFSIAGSIFQARIAPIEIEDDMDWETVAANVVLFTILIGVGYWKGRMDGKRKGFADERASLGRFGNRPILIARTRR